MGLEARQLQGWFSNRRLQEKARAMGVPAGQLRARAMRAAYMYTKQKVPARTPDALDPHQHMLTTPQPMLTCEYRLRPHRRWRSRPRLLRLMGVLRCEFTAHGTAEPCPCSTRERRQF
jgi:hypothetical protein